jgi:hypothetical protein
LADGTLDIVLEQLLEAIVVDHVTAGHLNNQIDRVKHIHETDRALVRHFLRAAAMALSRDSIDTVTTGLAVKEVFPTSKATYSTPRAMEDLLLDVVVKQSTGQASVFAKSQTAGLTLRANRLAKAAPPTDQFLDQKSVERMIGRLVVTLATMEEAGATGSHQLTVQLVVRAGHFLRKEPFNFMVGFTLGSPRELVNSMYKRLLSILDGGYPGKRIYCGGRLNRRDDTSGIVYTYRVGHFFWALAHLM